MTKAEAVEFIKNAKISVTKCGGLSENYYGYLGIVYVNPHENEIKTAFKADEYVGNICQFMEALKKYDR